MTKVPVDPTWYISVMMPSSETVHPDNVSDVVGQIREGYPQRVDDEDDRSLYDGPVGKEQEHSR